MQLHRVGELDAAEAGYDRILSRENDHPEALHMKGVIALQRGDSAAAVRLISRVVTLRPQDASVYSNLAVALLRLGMHARARDYALRSLALNPHGAAAEHVLGQACLHLGEHEFAVAAFRRALQRAPLDRPGLDGLLDALAAVERWLEVSEAITVWSGPHDDRLRIRHARALSSLRRFDEALTTLGHCTAQDSADCQVNLLKLRLERGEPELALPHGQRLLAIKDAVALAAFEPEAIRSIRSRWPDRPPRFRPNDAGNPERNVICFSLWGEDPKYTYNAVLNARLAPRIYPGWRARFYVDESVPVEIVEALANYGARVIHVASDPRLHLKLFWRFLASDDPQVERFLCRDCDAVINSREKAAVDEWLDSDQPFHLMRDHPEHAELIMAGMWGGLAGWLPDLSEQAVRYYENHGQKWRWVDQDFLRERVWPVIRDHALVHDDCYQMGGELRHFPAGATLPDGDHVGGYRPRFAAEVRASEVVLAAEVVAAEQARTDFESVQIERAA
jgi:tetratricopeptide (TPR) repeat protein